MQENPKGPISPNRQRAMNFLHSLGRRLGRRQYNDLIYSSEEDLRISSSETCCSTLKTNIKDYHSSSFDLSSEASSESSNNSRCTDMKRSNVKNNHRSRLSISSFSKALQNLSPSSKSSSSSSSSCNSTPLKQTNSSKAKNQPQRILRQPVHYVYLKGMSGLPTRRVPRSSICCQYGNR